MLAVIWRARSKREVDGTHTHGCWTTQHVRARYAVGGEFTKSRVHVPSGLIVRRFRRMCAFLEPSTCCSAISATYLCSWVVRVSTLPQTLITPTQLLDVVGGLP